MLIDAHSHLGNILNHNGSSSIIGRKGIRNKIVFDPVSISGRGLMRTYGLGSLPCTLLGHWVTRAERARNATATLENMGQSMDEGSQLHGVPAHCPVRNLRAPRQTGAYSRRSIIVLPREGESAQYSRFRQN
jgi:hypothetical protein